MQKVHVENTLQENKKKLGKIVSHEKMDILNIQLPAGETVPAHDAKETVAAWEYALNSKNEPVAIVLTRQDLPYLAKTGTEAKKGAYVVRNGEVRFNVDGEDHILTNEDVLIMEPLEKHSLEAITNADIIVMKIK